MIMKATVKHPVVIFILVFLSALIYIKPAIADDSFICVKGVRIGINGQGLRFVVDVSDKADFQVHSLRDPSHIYLTVLDAKLDEGFNFSKVPKDKFLGQCTIEESNFSQVTMDISLAYGVPVDNVKVFTLKEPCRIVIDVYRDYKKYQQCNLTDNILWSQTEQSENGIFSLINEILVEHKNPNVELKVELAKGQGKPRETVNSMVNRTNAVAGINAGYFGNNGENLGLVVKEGKIIIPSVKRRPPRTALILDSKRKVNFARISDKDGKLVDIDNKIWTDIVTAVGAGPRLIENGNIRITADEEGLGKGGNNIAARHAGRTAVGTDKKGNIVLTTISSYKDNHSDGVLLTELARYLKSRNLVDAMNMDGGGSTAMSVMGTLVSKPPMGGSYQRPVTNAILLFDKSSIISPSSITFEPTGIELPADGVTEKTVNISVVDKDGKAVTDGTIVSIASGLGLFKQRCYPVKSGIAKVNISSVKAPGEYNFRVDCGPARTYLLVKLIPGKPAFLGKNVKDCSKLEKSSPGEKKFIIQALVRDEFKNPLSGKVVEFSIIDGDGDLDSPKTYTKPDGVADTSFVLKTQTAKIKILTPGLEPIIAEIKGNGDKI
jgi:exopolysaccharide biosynthesis protein